MNSILIGLTVACYSGAMVAAASGSTLAHAVAFCVLVGAGAGLSFVVAERVKA